MTSVSICDRSDTTLGSVYKLPSTLTSVSKLSVTGEQVLELLPNWSSSRTR